MIISCDLAPAGCPASARAGLSRFTERVNSPVATLSLYLPLLNLRLNLHGEQRIDILGSAMVSASQIRNELAFYIAGILSLDDFENWFALNTWNVENAGSKAAEVLTYALEESLSEYTSGHIPEKKLREELNEILHAETRTVSIFANDHPMQFQNPPYTITSVSPSARMAPARL